MKKVCNIITYIAAFAFFLSLCSIETLDARVLATLLISGGWLFGAIMVYEEKRRAKGVR